MSDMRPIDVAHAALLEAGRRDLADWIHGWEDEDGFYLEFDDDEILDEADWVLIERAENLARQSLGLPPRDRPNVGPLLDLPWVDVTPFVAATTTEPGVGVEP